MTAVTTDIERGQLTHYTGLRQYLRETGLLVVRSLRTIKRVPERLSDVTIQPIMFTLLFLYVFGSAIRIPGTRYQDYLIPGLIGQSLAFGMIGAGVATANDFSSGVIDRFKSLPIQRLSVISAQVIGQVLEQILGLTIVMAVGLLLGWRPHFTIYSFAEFVGVLLLGLTAFTSVGVYMGMRIRNPDAVQGLGFAIVFPLAFLAGTFVPIAGMKTVPRAIGEWDPIAAFVAGTRHITQGSVAHGSWQLEHPIQALIGWSLLIIAICVPLAIRRFRRISAD